MVVFSVLLMLTHLFSKKKACLSTFNNSFTIKTNICTCILNPRNEMGIQSGSPHCQLLDYIFTFARLRDNYHASIIPYIQYLKFKN